MNTEWIRLYSSLIDWEGRLPRGAAVQLKYLATQILNHEKKSKSGATVNRQLGTEWCLTNWSLQMIPVVLIPEMIPESHRFHNRLCGWISRSRVRLRRLQISRRRKNHFRPTLGYMIYIVVFFASVLGFLNYSLPSVCPRVFDLKSSLRLSLIYAYFIRAISVSCD